MFTKENRPSSFREAQGKPRDTQRVAAYAVRISDPRLLTGAEKHAFHVIQNKSNFRCFRPDEPATYVFEEQQVPNGPRDAHQFAIFAGEDPIGMAYPKNNSQHEYEVRVGEEVKGFVRLNLLDRYAVAYTQDMSPCGSALGSENPTPASLIVAATCNILSQ